jgi:hypothetical protein
MVAKNFVLKIDGFSGVQDRPLWNRPLVVGKIVEQANVPLFELVFALELQYDTKKRVGKKREKEGEPGVLVL